MLQEVFRQDVVQFYLVTRLADPGLLDESDVDNGLFQTKLNTHLGSCPGKPAEWHKEP